MINIPQMAHKFFRTNKSLRFIRLPDQELSLRCYSTETTSKNDELDLTSIDLEPKYLADLTEQDEAEIWRIRNKSRLNTSDRNRLNGLRPYTENMEWFHHTIRWKGRMLGRHGIEAVDVTVGALWPTKEEIDDKIEFEKTEYPHTIQESWAMIAKRNQEQAEEIRLREELIEKNLGKAEQWKKDLETKLAKKEAVLLAIKERKERLVDEVRRHFGFKINANDERFKAMLEQKETEDKKRKKEANKQAKVVKFMAKVLDKPEGKNAAINEPKATKNN